MCIASCLRGNERPRSRLPLGRRAGIRNLSRSRLNAEYALARLLSPGSLAFEASRFHPALSARARREAAAGSGWLHEIKFDGYRVIGRKDGEQVRLWARITSDYSSAFTRIRDAVAALPVECAVLDGEAILLRPDNTSNFDGLRSRQGQAENHGRQPPLLVGRHSSVSGPVGPASSPAGPVPEAVKSTAFP